jgi:pyrroline-5-carboxylate reductase
MCVESLQELRKGYGEQLKVWSAADQGNLRVVQQAHVILVCVKPQICKSLFSADDQIRNALCGKLVISICAGIRIQQYKEWLPETGNHIDLIVAYLNH